MKTRILTVSCLMMEKRRGFYAPVPFIRLKGKWLEEAGFEPGDSSQAEVEYAIWTACRPGTAV